MSTYRCPTCATSFHDVENALDHMYSKHTKATWCCVVYNCAYRRRLSRHTRKNHPHLCEHSCSICGAKFGRRFDLSMHTRNGHHGNSMTPQFNTESELNQFIAESLEPNSTFNDTMKETVHNVCTFFQEHMNPEEIIKGGSMGKGTAVKNMADIDLVLVLNCVENAEDLEEKLLHLQRQIVELLNSASAKEQLSLKNASEIRITKSAVQFTVETDIDSCGDIDIDLLPTFEANVENGESLKELYNEMARANPSLREYYSASLVKLQVDFVKEVPANVKNLIRMLKYWRKEYLIPQYDGKLHKLQLPNSYILELIVIHLWEQQGRPQRFNTLQAFKSIMTTLATFQVKRNIIICETNYKASIIPKKIKTKRPTVMDPANPFNNIGGKFKWRPVHKAAKKALKTFFPTGTTSVTWV